MTIQEYIYYNLRNDFEKAGFVEQLGIIQQAKDWGFYGLAKEFESDMKAESDYVRDANMDLEIVGCSHRLSA